MQWRKNNSEGRTVHAKDWADSSSLGWEGRAATVARPEDNELAPAQEDPRSFWQMLEQ